MAWGSATGRTVNTVEIVRPCNASERTELAGSFAAWGAPQVQVGAGNYLPELVARYALAPYEPEVREVREHIGVPEPDVLTVVVVDGSAGLTARAPLALIESAPELHRALQQFVAGERSQLPEGMEQLGVLEPGLWRELASLDARRQLLHADDSLGVGRYVGLWEVEC